MIPPPTDTPNAVPSPTSFAAPDAAASDSPWPAPAVQFAAPDAPKNTVPAPPSFAAPDAATSDSPWPAPAVQLDPTLWAPLWAPLGGNGETSSQPRHGAAASPQRHNRWQWLGLAGVVLLLGTFAVTGTRSNPYAAAWDTRVSDLVTFVEQERGLTFKHPVAFDFMTESAFVSEISGGRQQPAADRQSLAESIMRARGYIGQVFSATSVEQDFVSNVTGYYSHRDKRMRVRGTELSAYIKLTLVHELTHALQDQRFGINALYKKVSSDEQAFVLQSLIEGDARAVENSYYRSLSSVDQRSIDDTEHPSDQPNRLSHTPDALQVRDGAPYELGAQMVNTLRHLGGVERLNEAFRHPPKGEAAVLFPFAPAATSSAPPRFTAAAGEQAVSVAATIDQRSVGPLSTFLTLSSRLDPTTAWRASTGWSSERIQIVHRLGSVCVDSMILGRTSADTERLHTAYESWAAVSPGATVTRRDEAVLVQSCDPKTDAPEPNTGIFSELFQLTETDLTLFKRAENDGVAANRAACAVLGSHQRIDALALDPNDLAEERLPSNILQALTESIAECKA